MIDIPLFKKILETETKLITEEDVISNELLQFLKKYKLVLVAGLFRETSQSTSKKSTLFSVEFACPKCKKLDCRKTSKSEIFKYLGYIKKLESGKPLKWNVGEFLCFECGEQKRLDEHNERIFLNGERAEAKRKVTDSFIETYLDPDKTWSDGVNLYDQLQNLIKQFRDRTNREEIAEAIKALPYKDFLSTPYWRCVAREVYRRAKFKCSLCSSNNKLNAHHPSYEFHGFEIEHIDDLICLCEECHSTFHSEREVSNVC